ncbi:hypothetical protein V6Z11_D05G344300 [Gossypium hirsutum]
MNGLKLLKSCKLRGVCKHLWGTRQALNTGTPSARPG